MDGWCDTKACWTFQGKKVLACLGGQLGLHVPEGKGRRVRWMGYCGSIAACEPHPKSPAVAYTGDRNGTIWQWDLMDGRKKTMVESSNLQNLRDMAVGADGKHVHVLVDADVHGSAKVIRMPMGKQAGEEIVVLKTNRATQLERCMLQGKQYLATTDNRKVVVWDGNNHHKKLKLYHTKRLTCVALHPQGKQVVAGDDTGRILQWHVNYKKEIAQGGNKNSTYETPKVTTRHWHSRSVRCLAFTEDGTHLLSGGEEGVLVMWQLETGKQEFLPRLGAILTSISLCPERARVAVRMDDNSVLVVNLASMKIDACVQGVKGPARGTPLEEVAGSAGVQPRSGLLALPTANSGMQLFDVCKMEHVADLDTTTRNNILLADDEKGCIALEPRVTHFAFNKDGSKLITVDRWPENDTRTKGEESLKFWQDLEGGKQNQHMKYSLIARTDNPFTKSVTCIAYHPEDDFFVTTSASGFFRLWTHDPEIRNAPPWRCYSMLSYKQAPSHAAAFSWDGSLLAVGAGSAVVLWEPQSNKRLAVLNQEESRNSMASSIAFVTREPLMVVALSGRNPSLTVWDLLSTSVKWSIRLDASHVVADPLAPRFAVVCPGRCNPGVKGNKSLNQNAHVLLFGPQRPYMQVSWRIEGSRYPKAIFATSDDTKFASEPRPLGIGSALVILSENRAISLATTTGGRNTVVPEAKAPAWKVEKDSSDPHFALGNLLGEQVRVLPSKVEGQKEDNLHTATQPWSALFDAPSHSLPSSVQLCTSFLKSIMADE
mmetsp:Transcript_4924/g.31508  ORF Transcript_4924/g.31508 Transcript_4924/m.31508 type:complete len:770 (+) Transcript_4924:196-2505(+)